VRIPPRRMAGLRALACWSALFLGACASAPAPQKSAPSPIDMQRGWKVYTYAGPDSPVGVTTLPNAPADTTRPDHLLCAIADAFCEPVRDERNAAADDRMKGFCGASGHATQRVVLAPGWSDEVPPYPDCFVHCVCEGRAPRTDDPAEQARESATGPCTNRLNCRLDCPK
jgi:hypothetical protein